ncbi:MAG TPA: UDP-glucose 4-epimerase, partial [Thiotrichales bacterium]|nr:UDP-glucose 4-epimerase [Thiotrichales bacterium]
GYSVLQVVKAFEQASGKRVPYQIVERRAGDVACVYANAQRAQQLLGWQAERDLAQMCTDSWHWQSTNPNGLEE